jgi:hypothetical protein
MMAFCFAIGFFVAAVIRAIARGAETLDFFHTHQEELKRVRSVQRLRRKHSFELNRIQIDEHRRKASKSAEGTESKATSDRYVAWDSKGASDFTLMDYYYPSEEKIKIIKNQDK